MSSRASDRVKDGVCWNSPSLRLTVASSSPGGFSRVRAVGARVVMLQRFHEVLLQVGEIFKPSLRKVDSVVNTRLAHLMI